MSPQLDSGKMYTFFFLFYTLCFPFYNTNMRYQSHDDKPWFRNSKFNFSHHPLRLLNMRPIQSNILFPFPPAISKKHTLWYLLRTISQFPSLFNTLLSQHLQDAYSEVASLFAEFFRDLDIVPSDIIAGLVLLRQRQRSKRSAILDQVSLPRKYNNACTLLYLVNACAGNENNLPVFCFLLLRPTMTFQPSYLGCL